MGVAFIAQSRGSHLYANEAVETPGKAFLLPFNHKLLLGSLFSWWAGVWQGAQTCLFPQAGAQTSCWTFTYPLPSPTLTVPGLWNCPLFSCAEGNGTPLQYSCLENSMDGGSWWATLHGAAEIQTWKVDFAFFISILPFGLEEAQAGIKIAGENINNLKYADDTTLRAES